MSKPNVLLVVFDTARRDALEPYGAPQGSSPVVADLARSGTALDRVYATAPWTVPSHVSMLTGLMPRAAGMSRVSSPAGVGAALAAHEHRLLATVMRGAGYRTAAASANLWLSKVTGFDSGFDDFTEIETDRNAQIHLDSFRERARWYAEAMLARVDDGAAQVHRELDRWVAAADGRPFFGFVNLLECHSPYLPPRPFGGWAPIARLKAARDARRHYTLTGIWRACAGVETVPEPVLERARAFYRASIRYMDAWLGDALERLDSSGVLEDTLVIVVADHGENFGEDGLIGHGLSLDERLINVPFVAAGPGADELELSSLAALPSAIARVCRIGDNPWADAPPNGVGVAQLDPPVAADDEERLAKLRGVGIEGDALAKFVTPLTAAVKGDLKLVLRGEEEAVFDLSRDPRELKQISPHELGDERRPELDALRKLVKFGDAAASPTQAPEPVAAPSDQELRDLEERMKLLGYM